MSTIGELKQAKTGGEFFAFLTGLLRNPRAVSSPTPSSAALARAIALQVDPRWDGTLVELGAGTGAITQALIDRGFAPQRILAIEYEPVLALAVRRRCPGVRVYCDDAFHFRELAREPVCAVVSGLPILHFPQSQRQALLREALAGSAERTLVQLSYSFRPPIKAPSPGISVTGEMVWRNFPPAHIWTYRQGPD